MKHSPGIYNELKEIAPLLAELEKVNVFYAPANYFSGLDAAILNKINTEYSLPASQHPFTVPRNYFENLAGNILQKIKGQEIDNVNEELTRVSPLLYQLQKENVFAVPSGYFETFSNTLVSAVKPPAKVVVMKKRSMVWNCAAAAAITGVMAISALWTNNTPGKEGTFTAGDAIVRVEIKDALQYKNELQINDGIANLSDADIVKYLESTGSNADDEAFASGIQEKELPDEADYLTNENTLQTFLDKAGIKNQN